MKANEMAAPGPVMCSFARLRSVPGPSDRGLHCLVHLVRGAVVVTLVALPVGLIAQAHDLPGQTFGNTLAALGTLPEAPQAVTLPRQNPSGLPGTMSGTVMDNIGEVVWGATVTLENRVSGEKQQSVSDGSGYFSFPAVAPGTYKVAIAAKGFAGWTETDIPMQMGADLDLPHIVLQVASATTDVLVVFSEHELAAEQVRMEEKQRVLGIVPNFYTSYVWHAAPLSPGQKFQLAWRSVIDPFSFIGTGVAAGIEQGNDDYSGFGQGAQGYAKRYGAAYADGVVGSMIGGAILPVLLRQDPRYFYKGTGTIRSRILYAISTTVICRGDNGRWQPNYSNVLGDLAAGAISNLYYPEQNRNGVRVTIDNALIGVAAGAGGALVQEFLLHHITPSVKASQKP